MHESAFWAITIRNLPIPEDSKDKFESGGSANRSEAQLVMTPDMVEVVCVLSREAQPEGKRVKLSRTVAAQVLVQGGLWHTCNRLWVRRESL